MIFNHRVLSRSFLALVMLACAASSWAFSGDGPGVAQAPNAGAPNGAGASSEEVHHFDWAPVSPLQLMNQPFEVAVTAKDAASNTVTTFSGPAELSAVSRTPGAPTNLLGNASSWDSSPGDYTLGYSFTPTTDLMVTHVRHYFGTKVSLWTDAGVLLAGQAVTSTPGTWMETALETPLVLSAGTRYRIGAYTGGGSYYYRYDLSSSFADGVIDASLESPGDTFLGDNDDGVRWWLVDLRYQAFSSVPIAMTPTTTGDFVDGRWTGSVTVLEAGNGVVLRAADADDHSGSAHPINVYAGNDLVVTATGSPEPVGVGSNLMLAITVLNSGPLDATGVVLTNVLSSEVRLVSATVSQGTLLTNAETVVCHLGLLTNQAVATATVVVQPLRGGMSITNLSLVSRGEADGDPANNVAAAVTAVGVGSLVIDDAGVAEGNTGSTSAVFTVTLSYPNAVMSTVDYATSNGTALAGSDYVATNGTLVFEPGVTSQTVTVWVGGGIAIESNETFYVNLSGAENAAIADAQGVGTITNDDGLPGQVQALAWGPVDSPQLAGQSFEVRVTARDATSNTVTTFSGPVALSATKGGLLASMSMIDDTAHDDGSSGDYSMGQSFTPSADITITHFRHYWGTKVSIWTDDGVLLVSKDVTSTPGTWVETALDAPLTLLAGLRYRIGAYTGGGSYYLRYDTPASFADGTIDGSYHAYGDDCPYINSSPSLWLVDLRYQLGVNTPLSIVPTDSGGFVSGVWTGSVTALEAGDGVVLWATDADGHSGCSTPINVYAGNDVVVTATDSPDPVSVGSNLMLAITVVNSGPADATGVVLTNVLSSEVRLVSVTASQGTLVTNAGTVVCQLGLLTNRAMATATVVVQPLWGGLSLTNVALVSRYEADGDPSNNVAVAVTAVGVSALAIGDAGVAEGNTGTTSTVFTVTLSYPNAVTSTVDYATSNGTALAGIDYVATNGTLVFEPGVTSQTVTVGVNGDIVAESNETFYVTLSGANNAFISDARGVGTITNDDGLPGQVHYFDWAQVGSPQLAGQPFGVTVTAKDGASNTVTTFSGPVALSAAKGGGSVTATMLSNMSHVSSGSGGYTLGQSFTPSTDIAVTHFRHYFGTKVSIWTDAGILVTSKGVVSTPGTWVETALDSPIVLSAGTKYRIGAYTGGGAWYYRSDMSTNFDHGVINRSYEVGGDSFPSSSDSVRWWFVDLRYQVGASTPIAMTPPTSGAFANGVWTGSVAALEAGNGVVLRAADADGHSGSANPINVYASNDAVMSMVDSPDPVGAGSNVTLSISVLNSGPADATEVVLTNGLSSEVRLISATASQGTLVTNAGTVVCRLGLLTNRAVATATVVVQPLRGGLILTNVALVSRGEADGDPSNNVAVAVTAVGVGSLVIGDAAVVEGVTGTTNAIFTVSLSYPNAVTSTVGYATVNGTAQAGSDYIATNGMLVFAPGVTSQTVTVRVNGDVLAEANETFYVTLSGVNNAFIADAEGVGTITNDDGLPGQVYYFDWAPLGTPQLVNQPFGVAVTARDGASNIVTTFTGPVALSAAAGSLGAPSTLLGNATHANYSSGAYTMGNSFTPNTQITVTHVRHYFGTKVSIWTDDGVMLVSKAVTSTPGTWVETALDSPLTLSAGTRYRIGAYTAGGNYYYRNDMSSSFADGIINASSYASGDSFPFSDWGVKWLLVDLRYQVGVSVPIPMTPPASGAFVSGVWTGSLAVLEAANGVLLRAEDADGHSGSANPINVHESNDLVVAAGSPNTVGVGRDLTISVSVVNSGPADATGVVLTNVLSSEVRLVSVAASQGSWVTNGGTAVCSLGVLTNRALATATIVVQALRSGVIVTNVAQVTRAETDADPSNNVAMVVTAVTSVPDLAPVSLVAPATVTSVRPRPTIEVTWSVTNQGTGPATGYWYDRIWFSTNGVKDAQSIDISDTYIYQSVEANSNYSQTCSVTLPMENSGPYWLFLQVDAYNWISEADEANNLSLPVSGVFTREQGSRITGTVTGSNGDNPVQDIRVAAYQWHAEWWWWENVSQDQTDSSGYYELGDLAAGTYRVQFYDLNGAYLTQSYSNASDLSSGTDIVVAEKSTVSNINASLIMASTIRGRVVGQDGVTPLQNSYAYAYRWNGAGWNQVSASGGDSEGYYELRGLAAGTYRVQCSDGSGVYLSQVYSNAPDLDSGTDIILAAASTVSNINASLTLASKITGTVMESDGVTPAEDSYVYAYRWNGSWWDQAAFDWTDSSGVYELAGLPAGTYRVQFFNWSGTYISEAYSNAPYLDLGMDILVPAAATVSNINAFLDEYASLGGVVTRADGLTPISGVRVYLLGAIDGGTQGTMTDENGEYLFTYLRPGDYNLWTEPTARSGYLGQWYGGALYVPGQETPPPGATVVDVASGASVTNIDFALDPAGRITGTVTGNGSLPIAGSRVKARNGTYGVAYEGHADDSGRYELKGLLPGSYTLKAEAALFRDEWWSDALQEDLASAMAVAGGDDLSIDFDLASGQSPALVEVTSDPSGAAIYLDYQATTNLTPALLSVGEIGDWDWTGSRIAPHVITVKKAGRPRPSPRAVFLTEAETAAVHFDLTSSASGCISIGTTPAGTAVFVDYADSAEGISPITVGNLAPGSHVILLKQTGYLQSRPVVAEARAGLTNVVSLPLTPNTAPERLMANARSVPPGAAIYVDYLPTTNVTDVVVDWMDPASHAGIRWHTASHTIMLRKSGFLPAAPRYVSEALHEPGLMMVNLVGDPERAVDEDDDGMPDQWEDAYRLRTLRPGEDGADDDPDGDGATNEEEMRAGTNPLDGHSRLAVGDLTASAPGQGQTITVIFATVPGRTYIVQCSDELTGGWTNLSGWIVATDYETAYTTQIPDGAVPRFYRMIALAP